MWPAKRQSFVLPGVEERIEMLVRVSAVVKLFINIYMQTVNGTQITAQQLPSTTILVV
jgi:hypothetical protein